MEDRTPRCSSRRYFSIRRISGALGTNPRHGQALTAHNNAMTSIFTQRRVGSADFCGAKQGDSRSSSTTGASHSVKRPSRGNPKVIGDHGGHRARNTACIIRIDSSCGYACFWGLFGRLAAFWRVFEVVLQVRKLRTLNGVVARADLFVTKPQVFCLRRNTFMLELRL